LQETQNSLASYAGKFHLLESLITEHDGFKHDIELVKEFMEDRKREAQAREQRHNEEFSSDDDDARSVATVVPHELERVDEEDEEAAAEHEDRRRTSREVGRPRTPEPSLAEFDDDDHHRSKPRSHIPEDIIHRLETLSGQLESALELSRSLQAQQASAQNTIQLLELKVTELQQLVQATQTKVDDQHEAHRLAINEAIESVRVPEQEREKERESLTEIINDQKKGVEGKWSSVQEEWSVEKDRLRRARDEWESKAKTIKDDILTRIESRLSVIQQRDSHPFMNGSAKPNGQGLVTPPSSRSLSSDSMRPRSRKKRNGSSRGRTTGLAGGRIITSLRNMADMVEGVEIGPRSVEEVGGEAGVVDIVITPGLVLYHLVGGAGPSRRWAPSYERGGYGRRRTRSPSCSVRSSRSRRSYSHSRSHSPRSRSRTRSMSYSSYSTLRSYRSNLVFRNQVSVPVFLPVTPPLHSSFSGSRMCPPAVRTVPFLTSIVALMVNKSCASQPRVITLLNPCRSTDTSALGTRVRVKACSGMPPHFPSPLPYRCCHWKIVTNGNA